MFSETRPTSTTLPLVNASLNGTAAILLLIGYVLIRSGRQRAHLYVMSGAFAVSSIFLGFYLYYHFNYSPSRFGGSGFIRGLYFAMLISHVILAVIVTPLVLRLLWLSWRRAFGRHAKLARYVWPVWMYVSVTGVLVYMMLYQWYPSPGVVP